MHCIDYSPVGSVVITDTVRMMKALYIANHVSNAFLKKILKTVIILATTNLFLREL